MPVYSWNVDEFDGASVLITGGTGSFGYKFARTLLEKTKVARLIIFSRDEHKQYDMSAAFPEYRDRMRFFIGDVRDGDRLNMAMRGVDFVIHAAAMKHVSIAEYNPFECIKTNVIGAEQVVNAAIASKVKKVIALSTDKACSPVNLYGASKLASDKIFQAAGSLSGHGGTVFCAVRYGNVVGSRGSVVPFFKQLLAEGTDFLPITDTRMTRFWITLQQGVDFVLSNFTLMRGGEIFVPKIPSMRVTDLASAMGPGLEQRVIGIRPGEKLHEAMITRDDARLSLELPDRFVIEPTMPSWTQSREELSNVKPVDEEFSYTSDNNTEWLTEEELVQMMTH